MPVTLHWQGNGTPPADVLQPLVEVYADKTPSGLMIVGEQGCIYTSHWNTGGLIRLNGGPRLKDVLHHDATKEIPETLPRNPNHGQEWIVIRRRGDPRRVSDRHLRMAGTSGPHRAGRLWGVGAGDDAVMVGALPV